MANVILQQTVFGGGKMYPAGYNIQIPDTQLVELIEHRLAVEAGERPKTFMDAIIYKRRGPGRPPGAKNKIQRKKNLSPVSG